jgi:eukaryotic-like serine/threonine-protein kinase
VNAGELVGDRYLLRELAGQGAMGRVFRATDRKDGGTVAVKLVAPLADPSAPDRFAREVRVLAALDHPAIVRYLDHGVAHGGERYLVTEWLSGCTLADALRQRPPSPEVALALVHRIASALGAAHRAGVVHRDIKPRNLFLIDGDFGRVKVLDFGVASWRESTLMTNDGQMVGTPSYMAPEQARSATTADARSDVFALGCILYECLTGRRAFEGEDLPSVLVKILFDELPKVRALRPEVPDALEALTARLMCRDPTGRPEDGHAAAAAIAGTRDQMRSTTLAIPPATPSAPTIGDELRRVVCVLGAREQRAPAAVSGTTATREVLSEGSRALIRLANAFGVAVESLADGSLVGVLVGAPDEMVLKALHCALALRGARPELRVVVTLGSGVVARHSVGTVVHGSLAKVARGRSAVLVDEAAAALARGRFTLGEADEGLREVFGETVGRASTLPSPRARLSGRDLELKILGALFDQCADAAAGAAVITGPAGIGKSALVDAALALVRARPAVLVLEACGDPLRAGVPFHVAGTWVRLAARVDPASGQESQRAALVAHVEQLLADRAGWRVTAEFLAELAGLGSVSEAVRAAREDARLMQHRLAGAWREWLAGSCRRALPVLVLDDAHHADSATLKIVADALEQLGDAGFLFLCAARNDGPPDAVRELGRLPAATQLALRPLPAKEARNLAWELSGQRLASDVLETIVQRAGGNPLFVEELVRAHAQGRHDAMPDHILGMLQGRLEPLGAERMRLLRAGAVLGNAFTLDAAAALLRHADGAEGLREAAERLVAETLLVRDGPDAYRFRQPLVREAAYAMITDADRSAAHMVAAGWLEERGADALVIADHHHRAGDATRAVEHYLTAAWRAFQVWDNATARRIAERALEARPEGSARGALLAIIARALVRSGEDQEVRRLTDEALELVERGTALYFLCIGQRINAIASSADGDELRRFLVLLRGEEPRDAAAAREKLVQLCHSVSVTLIVSDVAEVGRTLVEIHRMAPSVALDLLARGSMNNAIGLYALATGDLGAAIVALEECCRDREAAGDMWNLANTLGNLALAWIEVGRADRALEALSAARTAAGVVRTSYHRAVFNLNAARAHFLAGDMARASACAGEALAEARPHGNAAAVSQANLLLAKTSLEVGGLEEAESHARAACAAAVDRVQSSAWAHGVLARVLAARTRTSEAAAAAARALTLLRELENLVEGEADVLIAWLETAVGPELETARRDTSEWLRLRAARLADPELRASYLDIPEHARILELCGNPSMG